MISKNLTNVIIRVDDKPTVGNLVTYNGHARPGELVIDPTTLPPTVWVGDVFGNLNAVSVSATSIPGISTGSTSVNTTATDVTVTVAGSNVMYATSTGTFFNGFTNLGSNTNVVITGGTSGQVLTTDGFGSLSWNTPASPTTVPRIDFTVTGSGAGQTFSDAQLASYTNVNQIFLFKDGVSLPAASYTFTPPSTITVLEWLNIGSELSIAPRTLA